MKDKLRSRRQNRLRQIFIMPAALALLSGIGLVSALLGDDFWDVLSWVALGLPLVVAALAMVWARSKASSSDTNLRMSRSKS